ncbi:hypothetical protein C7S18_05465 [Ahniella affigens]|uniref:Peptidase S74 domain-containing protein n=1 Tax=Ahniella affigens TaxID=2021234 RepID=A0A2P1PPC3_9GAMM|nr:tail fiber domain-containing protein [Ahniella affigens]AVP96685.1 hypothetical protein C7S18_05465 [Ahniella affigens]
MSLLTTPFRNICGRPMHALAAAIMLTLAANAATAGNHVYRGSLTDGGRPAQGAYDLRLTLLDASGDKQLAAPLTYSAVQIQSGQFQVDLDFGLDLTRYTKLRLRTEVASTGGSFVQVGEPQVFEPKSTLGSVCWDTQGNAGTNDATDFLGTTDGEQLILKVGNAQVMRYDFPDNVIGGSSANGVDTFGDSSQTIAGGGSTATNCGLFLDQPCGNSVVATYGAIGGGGSNSVTNTFGTIAGGNNNTVMGQQGTIAGGINNTASAINATIAGGSRNTASGSHSVIGGGFLNQASGFRSGVLTGDQVIASGDYSAVLGGIDNRAMGERSNVAGGTFGLASGVESAVPGGNSNCAGGDTSFAAGTRAIVRSGNGVGDVACAVAGTDANGDEGTFIWSDAQASNFVSTGANQFLVRASGGAAINGTPPNANGGFEFNVYGNPPDTGFVEVGLIPNPVPNPNTGERIELGAGIGGAGTNDANFRIAHRNNAGAFFEHLSLNGDGSTIVRSNPANAAVGVTLAVGSGSWASLSDRAVKTDVAVIDPELILDRLNAMPISAWRYIGQEAGVRHLGPMAQDFRAAFGLGENDTTINTVDADGVALAAIQGLSRQVAAAKAENAALREQLARLEAMVQQVLPPVSGNRPE